MKKVKCAQEDATLQILLNLDGFQHTGEDGCRVEINAQRVNPTSYRPYGIKYRLVLLDPNGTRVIGYDNAHKHQTKSVMPIGHIKYNSDYHIS